MDKKVTVVIDINVILDVLQKREPHFTDSANVLAAAETGKVSGFVAAHKLTTLFYLITKNQSIQYARVLLADLMKFLSVAPVDQSTIEQALILPMADFEDAVQMTTAVQIEADYVITRNPKDFRDGQLPALSPPELLALL